MHTKGPWIQSKNKLYIDSPTGKRIAITIDYELENIGEAKANARLIAAAPELLETLDGALQFIELVGMKVPEELKRVVAKAKGLST